MLIQAFTTKSKSYEKQRLNTSRNSVNASFSSTNNFPSSFSIPYASISDPFEHFIDLDHQHPPEEL